MVEIVSSDVAPQEVREAAPAPETRELSVAIVPGAGSGLVLPDPSRPLRLRQHRADEVFSFEDTVQLGWERESEGRAPAARFGKLRALFFIVQAGRDESPILDLNFVHRVYDARNRVSGNESRQSGRRDPDRDLWYLPLTELIGAQPVEESAGRHEIRFDLTRANGKVESYRLLFRVLLPGLRSVRRADAPPLRLEAHGLKPLGRDHLWLGGDRIENPGEEPVRLRLELETELSLRQWVLQPMLAASHHPYSGAPRPATSGWVRFGARREFDLRVVYVVREGSRPERLSIDGQSAIELAPGETLELHWWAGLAADRLECPLPEQAYRFAWQVCVSRSHPNSPFCQRWMPGKRQVVEIARGHLAASGPEGAWARRIEVEREGDDPAAGVVQGFEQARTGLAVAAPKPSGEPRVADRSDCPGLYPLVTGSQGPIF